MPSMYDVKPAFQNLLRPLSDKLAECHITPNQITLAAIMLSFVIGLVVAVYPASPMALLLVPCALLLRMMLNAIDGMLAREYNMQSALGTFLNELGDVFSDCFLYLPFCLVPGISAQVIVIVVILGIVSEMTGSVAVQAGVSRRYEGPMGKSDRALVFGSLGLFLACGLNVPFLWNSILTLVVIMSLATIFNRIKYALSEVKTDAIHQ